MSHLPAPAVVVAVVTLSSWVPLRRGWLPPPTLEGLVVRWAVQHPAPAHPARGAPGEDLGRGVRLLLTQGACSGPTANVLTVGVVISR